MLPIPFNHQKASDYFFHILLPILAVGLPLFFLSLDAPIMPLITTTFERLFAIFGFCMWSVLLIVAYREIKAHPEISLEKGFLILLPLLTSFFFLVLIVEYPEKSWDYENYENAIRAVVLGNNPYESDHYLYPPLFAQLMASVYSVGERLLDPEKINLWLFVFYIHQCAQFFLVNLAYQLSSRFAANIGLSSLQNKLLEAMAMKIPCIVSSQANNAIHAPIDDCLLIADTPEAYVEKIKLLLNDQNLYDRIAENAFRFVRNNFAWSAMSSRLEKVLFRNGVKG